jgi:DNA polymerase elongation subunit (family B)
LVSFLFGLAHLDREASIFVRGTCDEVPGAVVHSKPTEKEMLLDWAGFMEERNADLLIGYDTFGFDEKYVWERAEQAGAYWQSRDSRRSAVWPICGKEVKLEETASELCAR